MAEWAYKFTKKKKSRQDTTELAQKYRFLARSAYKRTESGGTISHVAKVLPGDVIHAYYVEKKGVRTIGSFRVIDPDSERGRFERVWPQKDAALARVLEVESNLDLLTLLRRPSDVGQGYLPDPRLNAYTGWIVEPISGRVAPRYERVAFPSRHTLVRVDIEPVAHEQPDELLSRVVHNPDVMGGKPCIRGTRVTVGTILGLLASGHSFETILADFPYLQALDLRAALAYAAWRTQGLDLPLEAA